MLWVFSTILVINPYFRKHSLIRYTISHMIDFLQNYQTIVHYSLHLLLPGVFGYIFFRRLWEKAWLIMIAAMLVDLDHLFANPIFDPTRCSIGFHPLHSAPAIIVYVILLLIPNMYSRILGLGLLLHMLADWADCFLM